MGYMTTVLSIVVYFSTLISYYISLNNVDLIWDIRPVYIAYKFCQNV